MESQSQLLGPIARLLRLSSVAQGRRGLMLIVEFHCPLRLVPGSLSRTNLRILHQVLIASSRARAQADVLRVSQIATVTAFDINRNSLGATR